MRVNGTLINYYFHCKRQCYLHGNRLNLEDNSEIVKIGKAIHEDKAAKSNNSEIEIDKYVEEIEKLILKNEIPEVLNKPTCKKCAYYEFCYI